MNSVNLDNYKEWKKEFKDIKHLVMPKPNYVMTVIITIRYVVFAAALVLIIRLIDEPHGPVELAEYFIWVSMPIVALIFITLHYLAHMVDFVYFYKMQKSELPSKELEIINKTNFFKQHLKNYINCDTDFNCKNISKAILDFEKVYKEFIFQLETEDKFKKQSEEKQKQNMQKNIFYAKNL